MNYCFMIIFYRLTAYVKTMSAFNFTSFPRRSLVVALAVAGLTGCGGVPLASLPRLAQLSGQVLDADPSQFMEAVQLDARIAPPPGAAPHLRIRLKPKVAGAFEGMDQRLPLALSTSSVATEGLKAPGPGRRWLVYSLPEKTQTEWRRAQALVKQAKALPSHQRGGTLSLSVDQKELAVTDPALARTPWSTWMRVKQNEGFFEIWTGTPEDIHRLAVSR